MQVIHARCCGLDVHQKTQQVATKADGSQAPPSAETIHTTEKHPWLTVDRGWVKAGDLHIGEHVVELGGRTATITALRTRPGEADYYNLTVSELHTYAVGSLQAVVHNTGCPSRFDYDAASQSGKRPQGDLTRAGYEYQKHMDRGELPKVKGNSNLDSAGQNLLDDILTDPNADYQPVTSGNFAGGSGGYGIIGNSVVNGRFVGATFDANGVFQYFGVYPRYNL
jgi:hypothetical protein